MNIELGVYSGIQMVKFKFGNLNAAVCVLHIQVLTKNSCNC